MNRKMKTILILVIALCLATLSVVSFLYIRGTIRMVNQAKEEEKTANKVTQAQIPSQEAEQGETGTEEKTEPQQETWQNEETQTQQDSPEMKEYHLIGDNVWTVGIVDLYESDEESAKIICQIPGKTQLERVGASDEWALVRGQGLQGFVRQSDLSVVEPGKKKS